MIKTSALIAAIASTNAVSIEAQTEFVGDIVDAVTPYVVPAPLQPHVPSVSSVPIEPEVFLPPHVSLPNISGIPLIPEIDPTDLTKPIEDVGEVVVNGIKTGVTAANYFGSQIGDITTKAGYSFADMYVSLGDDALATVRHGFKPIASEVFVPDGQFLPAHPHHIADMDKWADLDLQAARIWAEYEKALSNLINPLIHADSAQCWQSNRYWSLKMMGINVPKTVGGLLERPNRRGPPTKINTTGLFEQKFGSLEKAEEFYKMMGVTRDACLQNDCLHPCFGSGFIEDSRSAEEKVFPHSALGSNCFKCFATASSIMNVSGTKAQEKQLLQDYYCSTCQVPKEEFPYCDPMGLNCNWPW